MPQYIAVRTPTLDKTEWWTSGLPFDAIGELFRIATTQSGHGILSLPNRQGGPQTINPSLTIRDGVDATDRDYDSFIEAFNMQERDKSVDAGTMVSTTSELGTLKSMDFTALKSVLPQSLAEEASSCLPVDLSSS